MPLSESRLRQLRSLSSKKIRGRRDAFLVEGTRLLQEAIQSRAEVLSVYHTVNAVREPAVESLMGELRAITRDVHQITAKELNTITDTVASQGIVAVVRRPHLAPESIFAPPGESSLIVACDAIADPGNLGAMIRTADWFAADGILLGSGSVELTNPKVVRGTMGGIFRLPVAEGVDLVRTLERSKQQGYAICVTDPAGGSDCDRIRYGPRTILVFGNEARGVSESIRSKADVLIAVSRFGRAESLNVAVASGIVLAAYRRTTGKS